MLEVSVLTIIVLLYVVPLNMVFYNIAEQTAASVEGSQISLPLAGLLPDFFYILYVSLLILAVYLALRFIILKSLYVYSDNEFDLESLIMRYKRGQRNIDAASKISIAVLLILHVLFMVFDIKIVVLAVLSLFFVFKNSNRKKNKESITKHETAGVVQEVNSSNTLVFEWYYNSDPLNMNYSVRFSASIPISPERYSEYQAKNHIDSSPGALREYVLDGVCPEIVDLAKQIKKQCTNRGFTTFHQASAVMAFQQSLRYVYDMDSKGCEEYVRYPLETLVDREGDCDCHGICSAAILFAMGYDVVLLRITYAEGDGHLAVAVEGADGISGNFFELNSRKYYYCEVTPSEGSAMNFKVGEMPDMPGASITVVPIKEIVSNL